jgi:hypothetical protein
MESFHLQNKTNSKLYFKVSRNSGENDNNEVQKNHSAKTNNNSTMEPYYNHNDKTDEQSDINS